MGREKPHCSWPGEDAAMIDYHDKEWGSPEHDDCKLFEFMVLDCFQAGLNWRTVLHKRASFRKAFDKFDVAVIAGYTAAKIDELMQDTGIIRNRLKITATIHNARCFLEVQKEYGSFDRYIWQFTGGRTVHNTWSDAADIPASSPLSDAMSQDLRSRGFKFAGTTICYAFMQATGMVNDHLPGCPRYRQLREMC